jgi:RNA-directed DNA polymerase
MVLEADLSRYFDTIEHKRLLKLIKSRVSDGAILSLIKRFLGVAVIEEDNKGKRRTISNDKKGVPQGGVISPLLANLYLDKLDYAVNALDPARVKMVRYADDFVILIKGGLEEVVLERVKSWLERAGLTLNESKTKLTDVSRKGKVEFLGFELSERCSPETGNRYIHRRPSKKSQLKFRDKIRGELHHWSTWRDSSVAIARVNRITRGWGNYFHYGHSPETFRVLNHWLGNRTRTWLAKKHKRRGKSISKYKSYTEEVLQKEYGLYMLPPQAAWRNR